MWIQQTQLKDASSDFWMGSDPETAAHIILCKLLKFVNRQKLYASLSNDLLCACLLHIKMDDPDRTTNSLLAPLLSKEGVIIYLVTFFFFWWHVTRRHKEDTACLVIINILKLTKKLKLKDYLNVYHTFFCCNTLNLDEISLFWHQKQIYLNLSGIKYIFIVITTYLKQSKLICRHLSWVAPHINNLSLTSQDMIIGFF